MITASKTRPTSVRKSILISQPHTMGATSVQHCHLSFPYINGVLEELSWVRFQVMHEGFKWDELAGWACIRLDLLGNGCRFVHMLNGKGMPAEGMILVNVESILT